MASGIEAQSHDNTRNWTSIASYFLISQKTIQNKKKTMFKRAVFWGLSRFHIFLLLKVPFYVSRNQFKKLLEFGHLHNLL